jgi:hypothetical protein
MKGREGEGMAGVAVVPRNKGDGKGVQEKGDMEVMVRKA